jgi:hypothetical protein
MIDFAQLVAAERARRDFELTGVWPDAGVTFETHKGSFVIPAALLEADDLAPMVAHYARNMPPGARPAKRERMPGGDVRVTWRRIDVVPR